MAERRNKSAAAIPKEEEELKEEALSASLTAYVTSLPEPQLKLLTSGISDDVVTAMKQLVEFILKAPGKKDGALGRLRRHALRARRPQAAAGAGAAAAAAGEPASLGGPELQRKSPGLRPAAAEAAP